MAHTISLLLIHDSNVLNATLILQMLILVGILIILFGQLRHVPGRHAARAHGRRRTGDPDGHSDSARRFEMGRAKLVAEGRLADLGPGGNAPGAPVAGLEMGRRSGVLSSKRVA